MIKRIVSLVISAAMILSACIGLSVQAEEDYSLLNNLGISINTDELDVPITRLELAQFAVEITKSSLISEGKAQFIDIPQKHKDFAVINTVYINGLMNGYSDGTFRPNENAVAMDAAGMLLTMLGYGYIVESAEITESEKQNIAKSMGIFNGVSNGMLTNRGLAKMLLNMLEAKPAEPTISGGKVNYDPSDESYLEKMTGYVTKKGIVQAVGGASLFGVETVERNSCVIDGEEYEFNGIDMLQYLGIEVRVIIDEENAKIIGVRLNRKIDEKVIKAEDISEYKDFSYFYEEGGRTKTIKIPSGARLIFNGKNMIYDENLMLPQEGSIRLVNTGSGGYDLIFIRSAVYMKIISYEEGEVLSDSIRKLNIDISDTEISCYENGQSVETSTLTKGKYIRVFPDAMIYETVNETLVFRPDPYKCKDIRIEVIPENKINGTITGVTGESLIIDSEEVIYSHYLQRLIDAGFIDKPVLKCVGVFYKDENNRLIGFEITSKFTRDSAIRYGYMTRFSYDESEEKIYITLVDEKAHKNVFNTSENFKVNGKKKTYSQLYNDENVNNEKIFVNGVFKHQLVGYETDSENNICSLYIAKDYANQFVLNENGEDTSEINKDYRKTGYKGYDNENFSLDYSTGKNNILYRNGINHLYSFGDESILFEVPKDPKNYKKYKVFTENAKSGMVSNSNYYIKLYNANENYEIGALVIDYTESTSALQAKRDAGLETFGGKSQACIITKKQTVYDEGQEEIKDILVGSEFIYGAPGVLQEVNLNCTDPEYLDTDTRVNGNNKPFGSLQWQQLETGDVILHSFDSDGNIYSFTVLFRYSELYNKDGSVNYRNINGAAGNESTIKLTVSKVISVLDDAVVFSPTGEDDYSRYIKGSTKNICVYNGKNVEAIDISEVRIGDTVFTRSESGLLKEMIVFR